MKKFLTILTLSAVLASCSTSNYSNRTYRVKRDNQKVAENSDTRSDRAKTKLDAERIETQKKKQNHVTVSVLSKEDCEQLHPTVMAEPVTDETITASTDGQPAVSAAGIHVKEEVRSETKTTAAKKEIRKRLLKPIKKMTKAQRKVTKAIQGNSTKSDVSGLLYIFLVILLVLLVINLIAELVPLAGNLVVLALLIALLVIVLT